MYKYKLFGCYMSEMWSGVYHNITMYCFTSFTNIHGPKNICWAKIILYIVTLAADVLFQSNGGVITMAMDGLSFTFLWIVSWTIHQLWEEFFDINSHFTLSLNPTNTLPPCLPPCWPPCQPFFFPIATTSAILVAALSPCQSVGSFLWLKISCWLKIVFSQLRAIPVGNGLKLVWFMNIYGAPLIMPKGSHCSSNKRFFVKSLHKMETPPSPLWSPYLFFFRLFFERKEDMVLKGVDEYFKGAWRVFTFTK